MGTSSSKFKKYLQHGDEYAAMQVYQNSSELRKNLHPNFGYGDHHQHNTPIHYASRHGMKHLIRAFLSDLGISLIIFVSDVLLCEIRSRPKNFITKIFASFSSKDNFLTNASLLS